MTHIITRFIRRGGEDFHMVNGPYCRALEVVPVGDVVQWLDENYGTPDADRFLEEFGGRCRLD